MGIPVRCTQCGRLLDAPYSLAGGQIRCRRCDVVLDVPDRSAEVSVVDDFRRDFLPAWMRELYLAVDRGIDSCVPRITPPAWAYLIIFFALFPLLVAAVTPRDDVDVRLRQTLSQHGRDPGFMKLEQVHDLDALLAGFRENKLNGALLPRNSKRHYVFAALSGVGYLAFACWICGRGRASAFSLAVVALFTGTLGIAGIFLFQQIALHLAMRPQFDILKLLGLIYLIGLSVAIYAKAGFFTAFLANTLAVGVIEELCKLVPILTKTGNLKALGSRGALVWGFCSGIGFGIAEGIHYSAGYYNGIAIGIEYVIRFVSVVALHGVLCGASSLMVYRNELLPGTNRRAGWIGILMGALVLPAILHGFYNASVGRGWVFVGFCITVVSVMWLAYCLSVAEHRDFEEEDDDMETGNVSEAVTRLVFSPED